MELEDSKDEAVAGVTDGSPRNVNKEENNNKDNKRCATEEFLRCDQCIYKCKKESALHKHKHITHAEQS